jgi:hypothetical protein
MASINASIERIEDKLPPVAAGLFRLNRAVVCRSVGVAKSALATVSDAAGSVAKRGSTGAKTLSGQASSAAERSSDAIRNAVEVTKNASREVRGQAKAQTGATVGTAERKAVSVMDRAVDAIDDRPAGAYETWTKAELYERAQELDIDGRSGMSKKQLIGALRSA